MANDARKISDLTVATTLTSTDRVVVLINPATTANVETISANSFMKSLGPLISGPFTNDSVANTNGISLRGIYYDTNGIVRLRII
jgi:hypothetical protein